ncbi:MAG: pantetheine-phosphate adenylyltransferase [Elusimicrobia bacterium]|nr:pantetheine-phosphate adenylyltransferase [Elusimicrobiota bacterium]MDE2236580.1 pantetheine-phosphate adenylyltransferase [Elusimicrobiota bacterium]MDE2424377.1 pantetheine-phosphate adenylyltransferase [Elusimicrobiota bacterium]
MSRLAVYPGSFDPVTKGHLDIIQRAARLFDFVIVAVSNNSAKRHTFSVSDRIEMIEGSIRGLPNVDVDTFSGLLVDYLRSKKSHILIRGVRVVSDMDYEFQLASFNRRLYKEVETVFLMPDEQYTYLAASMVKEVARLGASVDPFVTPVVARTLKRTLKRSR